MQFPDEEALVEQARRGDLAAFEALVVAYRSLTFRTAFVIAGNAEDAEEAAQDAFVKAHRALGRFRSREPFRPWLLTIVANEARNRRRARGRRGALTLRAAAEPQPEGEGPEEAALVAERRGQLLASLERLRDDDRDVLACRYLLDLSEEETAAALGIPRGTVKSRTHRARLRLEDELR